jgi:hypothetical protein
MIEIGVISIMMQILSNHCFREVIVGVGRPRPADIINWP